VLSSRLLALADLADPPENVYRAEPWMESPGTLAGHLDPTTRQTPALDIIDAALVDVAHGEKDESSPGPRLVISMPPQEGKSSRVTHYGALWMLARNPDLRIGIVSYGEEIARRFSYEIRNDILTYDGSEGNADLGLRLQKDVKAVGRWSLTWPAKGGVYAVGIGGSLTGRPIDVLLIDDPVKDFRDADSVLLSAKAWEWWQAVARPRLAPGAPVIVILTRWHELDLAGRLFTKQAEDEASTQTFYDRWRVINIPAQADHDPAKGETDPLGREPGEFMVSARARTKEQWLATKNATAPRIWTALYQGRPSPEVGDVWHKDWWVRYRVPIWSQQPDGSFRVVSGNVAQSWDFTFKDTKGTDFVVGQVWRQQGAQMHLMDQVRARLSFTDSLAAMRRMRERWPQTAATYVEEKANGAAVIDSLKLEIPGLIPCNPKESKYARATAVSPFVRAGNVLLPEGEAALFDVEGFIVECTAFPNATHDDQVDATSQALSEMLLLVDGGGMAWLNSLVIRCPECGEIQAPGATRCHACQADIPAQAMAAVVNAPGEENVKLGFDRNDAGIFDLPR
jgi:predicted phage terminase large subunit-like protein